MNRFVASITLVSIVVATVLAFIECRCSLVAHAMPPESKFSPFLWQEKFNPQIDREGIRYTSRDDEFRKFLRDYNLIGMEHSQVIALLGEKNLSRRVPGRFDADFGKYDSYLINSMYHSSKSLQIEYVDGRVSRWRFYENQRGGGPWNTTDLVNSNWRTTSFDPLVVKDKLLSEQERGKQEHSQHENTPAQ